MSSESLWDDASVQFDIGKYQDAQKLFKDFVARHPDDPRAPEARIRIGICDYMLGRVQSAIETWNRTVNEELAHERAGAALLLGLEYLCAHHRSQNDMPALERILSHLADLFPDALVTYREHVRAARESIKSKDYAVAAALYERVRGRLKGDDLLDYELARKLSRPGASAADAIASADMHLIEKSLSTAARLYEEAMNGDPSDIERAGAMTKLGWCLYLQGEYDKAEKLWREVVASAPTGDEWRARSRWHLAVLNEELYNNYDVAVALCEEQAKEFEGGFLGQQALFAKARLFKKARRWKEAKKAFEQLIAVYPDTADCPPIYRYIEECESKTAKVE